MSRRRRGNSALDGALRAKGKDGNPVWVVFLAALLGSLVLSATTVLAFIELARAVDPTLATAEGAVTGVSREASYDSDGSPTHYYAVDISYDLEDGHPVTFREYRGDLEGAPEEGSVVTVKYDPCDPSTAHVSDGREVFRSFIRFAASAIFLLLVLHVLAETIRKRPRP